MLGGAFKCRDVGRSVAVMISENSLAVRSDAPGFEIAEKLLRVAKSTEGKKWAFADLARIKEAYTFAANTGYSAR